MKSKKRDLENKPQKSSEKRFPHRPDPLDMLLAEIHKEGQERIAQITPESVHEAIMTGPPVGKEWPL